MAERAYNAVTGEVIAVYERPSQPKQVVPFTMLFGAATIEMLVEPGRGFDLTRVGLKVWLFLVASSEYGNRVEIHVSEMARVLRHSRSAVSRALSELERRRLVYVESRRDFDAKRIMLDPSLVLRGNVAQHRAARREWRGLVGPPSRKVD